MCVEREREREKVLYATDKEIESDSVCVERNRDVECMCVETYREIKRECVCKEIETVCVDR